MAEKEDYIVISKKDFDYKKGHYVTHSAKQMSHTEAIGRIAKALCADDVMREGYYQMAEVALNAILEGK